MKKVILCPLAALAAMVAVRLGGGWALGALMARLQGIWGVTAANIHLAPGWVHFMLAHASELTGGVTLMLLWPAAWALNRAFGQPALRAGRGAPGGACQGAALSLAVCAGLFAVDALRLGWPLTSPRGAWALLVPVLYYLAAALGRGALVFGLIHTSLARVNPWVRRAVTALCCAAAFAPGVGAACLVNYALIGLIAAMMTEKTGGYGWAAGFMFGMDGMLYVVMGAGGAPSALYESYPALYDWLSGAGQGPAFGFMLTLPLILSAAYMIRKAGARK